MAIGATDLLGRHLRTESIIVRLLHVHHENVQHTLDAAFGPQVAAKSGLGRAGWKRRRPSRAHFREGGATGTEVVAHPQERAMPKPLPPQVT